MNMEEIKKRQAKWKADPLDEYTDDPDIDWLIAEVERLQILLAIEKDYPEIYGQVVYDRDYQRRHRKWALKQCKTWQRHFCFYKDDAVKFHSDRADKAETERDKLIGALEGTFEYILADNTFCWCYYRPDDWAEQGITGHSSWCLNARAILAERRSRNDH